MAGANPPPPLQMPYLASLNIPDLTKLTNDPILHDATWPAMPTKLPSDIPKFEGKAGDDPANHVMTFHLWCSSNSIMEDSVRLRLFQRTLTGPSAKWYVEEKSGSHSTFESLAKAFLTFFQLPIRHDNGLELLSNFKQSSATHIADHIHEWRRRRSLCKAETTKQQCLDWFLRSLVALLGKDVASTFPQSEEEAISKAQQYDLIYAQSGYLYTVLPDLPKPVPFGQDKPGMSHSADGLIGTTMHHSPQPQPPPMYGTPQYPPAYGGTSYYPPPPYQQPYPMATPPPISGPPPAPPIHPPLPNTSGPPSTSPYSTSESATPSYVPYGAAPPQNPYFPFPGPSQPMAPPHPNAGVNFVQPSAAQQYQNFEQLNTANPTNPSNNNRRKGRNRNNNNPNQGGNQPPQQQPTGGNPNQGNQNPQGGNNNKRQGRNTVKTIHPCALCGVYGHYTHHCPQIADFKRLKDSGSIPPSPAQPAPPQAQQYAQQPPAVLQNPIPHQGVINTQQDAQHPPPQMGQYHNPNNPAERTILLTSEEEILLQTRNRQYPPTAESTPTSTEANPTPTGPPLVIPRPSAEPPLRIPRIPLRRNVHNPQARAAHNYSLVDDLAQSPAAMSVLEVLQTCPTQRKSLLSAMGAVDPADTRLITFDLDNCEPRLPAAVAIQIPVKIRNITVHRCIIDEGASTCIMSKSVWQKLGSPELLPSAITLRAYDGRSASPEGIFQNVPIELGGKTVLIDIEVIEAPLEYNILLGRTYMYAMKAVASSIFRTIMFPHNGKIVTIDQVTHYEPNPSASLDNILPLIHTNQDMHPFIEMGPGMFKDPSLLGTYHGAPPLLPPHQVCGVSSQKTLTEDTLPPQEASVIPDVSPVAAPLSQESPANSSTPTVHEPTPPQGPNSLWETVPRPLTQIPFFYPPPGVEAFQVAATLTLPNMVLAIPVWYLHPPEMVPRPQAGLPMTIPVLTPNTPIAPILPTPLTPILPTPPATAGGRRAKKEPTAPRPPRIPPPCALCDKEGHQTNNCPSLPELRNLIPPNPTPTSLTTTATLQPSSSKELKTKCACAICSEYGHYTHHCPSLPRFRQALDIVSRDFQNNPRPSTTSTTPVTDIHYVTTSVNERMRCPCSLCDSLTHFTYQCPIIVEYRHRQMALRPQPAPEVIDLTSPSADLHIISPEPEALPTPPWFLDDLSEDLPRNPPNSPAHSSTETRHPTTTGSPQYLNIWFMSSEPSSTSTPSVPSVGGTHTSTEITPPDPLYSRRFQCDEEILEELQCPDSPWDALHHRALFLPQETPMPPSHNSIFAVETKDFIPSGMIDWFNNPIPAPDAFEEGNLANISPTIKIDISIKPGVVEEIIIGAACTPEEITAYKALFQEFRDIFAWSYTEMPGIDPSIVEHRIDTWPDITPVRQKQRPLHPAKASAIKAEVDKLRTAGFIYPIAYTSWVSNPVPVDKKQGTIRVCTDFRDLNNACPKDNFPTPFIDQIIDDCAGHEALSFMDGFSGYNQIQIHPADQYKTAFITPWGTFAYRVMPFGLKNAGATFQRAMTYIFHDLAAIILAYLDDLTARSKKRTQHLDDLRIIFQRCRQYNIRLNPLKCVFCVTAGRLLGFIVSQSGITVDPLKVQAITEIPPPRNLRQLQSLQGKANFLRRFVPDYAVRAHGFLRLLRHDIPFHWDDYAQQSFDDLKTALSNAPLISAPDYDRDYILYVSASAVSVAGVLVQLGDDNREHVIYYVSKNLSGPPLKYKHEEKLALAVVLAVQKLRHYILLRTTKVVADSNPMQYLLSRRQVNGKFARWIVILQEYDLEFSTPKSKKALVLAELVTDLPSNTPSAPVNTDFPDEHLFYIASDDPWYGDLLVYLRTQKFGQHLSRDDRRRIRHQAPRYLLIGDILYRRGVDTILRRCLTIDEADKVLNDCHSGACGGHLSGIATAQKIIRASYFWPTLFHDCIHAVRRCEQCQLYANKARAPPALLHPVITAGPFCKWGIDFMTCNPPSSNGHKYIVVAVDYFTKWAEAMPTFNNTADTAARFFFNHVISRFGVPLQLVSDHGKHFENEIFVELSSRLGFSHEFASPYYPQSNGQVEAVNKVLKTMLQRTVNKHKTNWHHMLFSALWAYRTAVKTATGFTPFHLVHGVEATLPIECEIPTLRTAIELLPDTAPLEQRLLNLESLDEDRQSSLQNNEAAKK
jgi:hypothetical protein